MADMDFSFLDKDSAEVETTDTLPNPVAFARRVEKRQYIDGLKKQALNDLICELPPPDTDLYILSNGSGGTYHLNDEDVTAFEFGHFIPVIVGMLGNQNCTLYVSTWTMNRIHAQKLLQLVDDGKIKQLAVMTAPISYAARPPLRMNWSKACSALAGASRRSKTTSRHWQLRTPMRRASARC